MHAQAQRRARQGNPNALDGEKGWGWRDVRTGSTCKAGWVKILLKKKHGEKRRGLRNRHVNHKEKRRWKRELEAWSA